MVIEHVVKQSYDCTMSTLFNQTSVAQSSAFPVNIEMTFYLSLSFSQLSACKEEYTKHCGREL